LTQPANQTVVAGNTATFTVVAGGIAPLSYQWSANGVNIAGATSSGYSIGQVQAANAGLYAVIVSNCFGSVTSGNAVLTVVPTNRLGYWPFDNTNTWIGAQGQLPLLATNIVGVPSWSTNAVLIDNTNVAILAYRDVETSGNPNIILSAGTIRFWFKPDWSSVNAGGNGPGVSGRLIEVGSYSYTPYLPTNSSVVGFTNGWWALYFSPDGNELYFGSSTNGGGAVQLSASITWSSNQWHQLALTYTPTNGLLNSLLYLDGQPVASGSGGIYYPNAAERAKGFRIGSDQNGNNQTAGVFDELETFNYPVDPASILANYQAALSLDSNGNGLSNILENQLGLNPYSFYSSNGLNGTNVLQVFTPLK
jgi:hypothetical protein